MHFFLYNENMDKLFCTSLSAVISYIVYLLGGFDIALQCLLVAIILDYISGITKAFITKEVSSKTGFKGLLKKIMILFIVMLAVIVDRVTLDSGAIRTLVIYYFVANEGLSILENLGQAGLPIPKSIKNALKSLKDLGDEKDKKKGSNKNAV